MSLPFLFVAVSVAELAVLVAVESRAGLAATLLLILLTGVLGASLVRRQGLGVLHTVKRQLAEGVFPGREIAHGAIVLAGGILLLTPGFLTDLVGFALMVPALREQVRLGGMRFLRRRASFR